MTEDEPSENPPKVNDTFTTGQVVPVDGRYVDQYGDESIHRAGGRFPPTIRRRDGKSEVAVRALVKIL